MLENTDEITEENKRFINITFKKLKIVCDETIKNPTCENIRNLSNVINNVETPIFKYIWEYVLYPIQFHLLQHNKNSYILRSKILIDLLRCLNEIISKIKVNSISKFIELNILLLQIITKNKTHVLAKQVSEEVKFEVINCVISLYKNVSENLLGEMYNFPTKNYIFHAGITYVCIQIVKEEKLLKLKIISLKCLLAVIGTNVNEQVISSNTSLKFAISETVASMLPGIISMCHFISSNLMLHHKVHIYCLRVFSRSVTSVFETDTCKTVDENLPKFDSSLVSQQFSNNILSVRTEEWHEKCMENLVIYIQNLISSCHNMQWKTRLELVKAAGLILILMKLFDLLVILSHDEIKYVSEEATFSLSTLCKKNSLQSRKFVESLKERLFYLLEHISCILNSADEEILLSQLNLLNGYLNLLDLEQIWKASIYHENLFSTLIKVINFDLTGMISFHQYVENDKRKFSENHCDMCKTILNVYLDPIHWSIRNENFSSTSNIIIKNNIIQVCLLIEGIGNMAFCLMQNFKPFLSMCLYKIIETAGSTNALINIVAINSIKKIAKACNYSSITELISDNVESIMSSISWKLHNLKRNLTVFDVFYCIIMNSEKNSLSTLLDLMQTLVESNDIFAYCEHFLRIFKIFTRKLRKWFSPLHIYDAESNDENVELIQSLYKFLNENNENKECFTWISNIKDEKIDLNEIFFDKYHEEDLEHIDQSTADNKNISFAKDNNKNITHPQYIQLVISVALKVLHLLPVKRVLNKIQILDILVDTLLILCDNDVHLLPLVHKIWLPLVNRFKYDNSDPLIMKRCFQLLCIIATVARDFIRTRTLTDILPVINNFLLTSAVDSKLKDKNSVYRMSQKYKLQFTILSELGYLALYICLQEKDINSLLVSITPYLSSQQPLPLQNACITTFNILKYEHKDLIQIHLMSIWFSVELLECSGNINFPTIKIKLGQVNDSILD
ncbi:hypothetical protein PGB90_002687 [Kerria lacca]